MARLKKGILGAFQGKVGPVVGYERKGKGIIQSKSNFRGGNVNSVLSRNAMNVKNFNRDLIAGRHVYKIIFDVFYKPAFFNYNTIMTSLLRNSDFLEPGYYAPITHKTGFGVVQPIGLEPTIQSNDVCPITITNLFAVKAEYNNPLLRINYFNSREGFFGQLTRTITQNTMSFDVVPAVKPSPGYVIFTLGISVGSPSNWLNIMSSYRVFT